MKKIFTTLLILTLALPAASQHMLIEKNDNNNEVISLENLTQITFDDTTVNVEQNDGTKSSNTMSAINRISFGDYTGIREIKPASGELITYITSDEITINSGSGSQVSIYNLVGSQMLCTRLATDNGRISIATLPKGIYIVKANNRTAKIVRR